MTVIKQIAEAILNLDISVLLVTHFGVAGVFARTILQYSGLLLCW